MRGGRQGLGGAGRIQSGVARRTWAGRGAGSGAAAAVAAAAAAVVAAATRTALGAPVQGAWRQGAELEVRLQGPEELVTHTYTPVGSSQCMRACPVMQ